MPRLLLILCIVAISACQHRQEQHLERYHPGNPPVEAASAENTSGLDAIAGIGRFLFDAPVITYNLLMLAPSKEKGICEKRGWEEGIQVFWSCMREISYESLTFYP